MIDPDCDVTKGCLSDCIGDTCSFLVTWRNVDNQQVEFEISSLVSSDSDNHWAAIGLSTDKLMGDDSIAACISVEGKVSVEMGYTNGKSYESFTLTSGNTGLTTISGSLVNTVLTCKFSRMITITGEPKFYDLQRNWHLLFARGQTISGSLSKHSESPVISTDTVDFLSAISAIGGQIPYPLVKVHGSLMVTAWVLFASIGMFTARYLKNMWPNSKILGVKVWYMIHRICMGTVVLLTFIAVVTIFVEAQGNINVSVSDVGHRFAEAHPVLGLFVTCLAFINPIMALFRCAPDHKRRPIFNFFHRACGTIAHGLAALTIIFGTYLDKARLKPCATYTSVAYIVVFITAEAILEIYLCMQARKKGRTDEIELSDNQNKLMAEGFRNTDDKRTDTVVKCIFAFQITAMFAFMLALLVLINKAA